MDTYIIKNFRVLKNDEKYKYADHAFKLAFISGTGINAVEIPDMPVSAYKFKKFKEIKAFQFREDLLYGMFFILLLLYFNTPCYIDIQPNKLFQFRCHWSCS
jgi:hypothetical protein